MPVFSALLSFHVALSLCYSCNNFLYFIFCSCIHVASLFISHSFSVSGFLCCLFQYCSSFKLHNLQVAFCPYCTIFVLHVFYVALFLFCIFFMLYSLHALLYSLSFCYFFLFHFFFFFNFELSLLIIFIKVSSESCWYFSGINFLTVHFSGDVSNQSFFSFNSIVSAYPNRDKHRKKH